VGKPLVIVVLCSATLHSKQVAPEKSEVPTLTPRIPHQLPNSDMWWSGVGD